VHINCLMLAPAVVHLLQVGLEVLELELVRHLVWVLARRRGQRRPRRGGVQLLVLSAQPLLVCRAIDHRFAGALPQLSQLGRCSDVDAEPLVVVVNPRRLALGGGVTAALPCALLRLIHLNLLLLLDALHR
jgi:hypothetical protein